MGERQSFLWFIPLVFLLLALAPSMPGAATIPATSNSIGIVIVSETNGFDDVARALEAAKVSLRELPGYNAEVFIAKTSSSAKYEFEFAVNNYALSHNTSTIKFDVVHAGSEQSVPKFLNDISHSMTSKFILFLSSNIVLDAFALKRAVAFLTDPLNQNSSYVLGGKSAYADGTLSHSGVEFALGSRKAASYQQWSFGVAEEDDKSDIALAYVPLQGFSLNDSRISKDTFQPTSAVHEGFMMIPRQLFESLGGFNTSYHYAYYAADFCHQARQSGATIGILEGMSGVYPILSSNARTHYDMAEEHTRKDALVFHERVGREHVVPALLAKYELKNISVIWNMECGAGQVLGFTMEAINFVTALEGKIRIKAKVNNIEDCVEELKKIGVQSEVKSTLYRAMAREVPADTDVITVIHRDPGRYAHFIESGNEDGYTIGRSMFETDSIPEGWAAECNDARIDEIWVPSQFNVETFSTASVNSSKLRVIPELIDVNHFDPKAHPAMDFMLPFRSPPLKNAFIFLTIMKWEPRKAWRTLLSCAKAFFDEFSGPDSAKAGLVVVSRMDQKSEDEYSTFVKNYTAAKGMNGTMQLPVVRFIHDVFPYTHLPSVYKSADAFVLPSHGEGWGLPLMEAMAMELPAVGTNWSGTTAFMSERNSYPVEISGLEPAPIEGHKWATPNATSLRKILRSIFVSSEGTRSKSAQARLDVVANYSKEAVSKLVIERLKVLQPQLATLRATKAASKKNDDSWFRANQNNGAHGINAGWRAPGSQRGMRGGGGQRASAPADVARKPGEFVDEIDGKTKYRIKINEE